MATRARGPHGATGRSVLWRGGWATRGRIVSGLILFAFALTHLLNHALGLISVDWMEWGQTLRQGVTRSAAGQVVLPAALLLHVGLALAAVVRRRSLRMPWAEAAQIGLGLAIPLLLIPHLIDTAVAATAFGVKDYYVYMLLRSWAEGTQGILGVMIAVVWLHACLGLHFWLRQAAWWRAWVPAAAAAAALVPCFAYAGYLTAGRALHAGAADPGRLRGNFNWPDAAEEAWLALGERGAMLAFLGVLLALALAMVARRLLAARTTVPITYADGPRIAGARGLTLLEMSRGAGVAHVSACGGRGRCTTCRVVVETGMEALLPPSAAEASSLHAVRAGPGTRLACQIRPQGPLTVHRVFRDRSTRARASSRAGAERRLCVLFLDMRGFTARTAGQMPYDVLYLLNRFFDAVVPAIAASGGRIDKYMGDGLIALFDDPAGPAASARAALAAVAGIDGALTRFNEQLAREGAAAVRIGLGLHAGVIVMGEIGAEGQAPPTIIGDAVNAASRLESLTKEMGVQALVSRPVFEDAGVAVDPARWHHATLRGFPGGIDVLPLAAGADGWA